MKSLFIALVWLFLVSDFKSEGASVYFEFTCADEHFEPQNGRLHLIVNYKDSTVDDRWRKGFNFR